MLRASLTCRRRARHIYKREEKEREREREREKQKRKDRTRSKSWPCRYRAAILNHSDYYRLIVERLPRHAGSFLLFVSVSRIVALSTIAVPFAVRGAGAWRLFFVVFAVAAVVVLCSLRLGNCRLDRTGLPLNDGFESPTRALRSRVKTKLDRSVHLRILSDNRHSNSLFWGSAIFFPPGFSFAVEFGFYGGGPPGFFSGLLPDFTRVVPSQRIPMLIPATIRTQDARDTAVCYLNPGRVC